MHETASASVKLSLKSTRSARRSLTAARTAATRAMPSSLAPETLILAVVKPRRSHSAASRAACSGATVPIHAFSVTSCVSAPPSSERDIDEDGLDRNDAHGLRLEPDVLHWRGVRKRRDELEAAFLHAGSDAPDEAILPNRREHDALEEDPLDLVQQLFALLAIEL